MCLRLQTNGWIWIVAKPRALLESGALVFESRWSVGARRQPIHGGLIDIEDAQLTASVANPRRKYIHVGSATASMLLTELTTEPVN